MRRLHLAGQKYNNIKFINLILNERTFNDIYKKKNKWFNIVKGGNVKELSKNLYVLIKNAYKPLGGHFGVQIINDISKYNYWEAIDNDDDPDADAVLFGRKNNGIKISGVGHDGRKEGKFVLLRRLANTLKRDGYWIEASKKIQKFLLKRKVIYITDKKNTEIISK